MSQFTPEWYELYEAKRRHSKNSRARTLPQLQEPKAHVGRPSGDGAKCQAMDATSGAGYFLSVTFLVSDRRRRDPTGMFETIADVLVRALRRFNPRVAKGELGHSKSAKRTRGSNHNHTKVVDI